MAKVAFIGLGVMGYPMAGHLARKGGHERQAEGSRTSGRKAKPDREHERHSPGSRRRACGLTRCDRFSNNMINKVGFESGLHDATLVALSVAVRTATEDLHASGPAAYAIKEES